MAGKEHSGGRKRDQFRKWTGGQEKKRKIIKADAFVDSVRKQGLMQKFLKLENQTAVVDSDPNDVNHDVANVECLTTSSHTEQTNITSTSKKVSYSTPMSACLLGREHEALGDSTENEPLKPSQTCSQSSNNECLSLESVMENRIPTPEHRFPPIISDDPGSWQNIEDIRDTVVKRDPVQIKEFDFPRTNNRSFSIKYYKRTLPNGEIVNRSWLLYSPLEDAAYCFSCKLFPQPKNSASGQALESGGFRDWKHLGQRIQQHERSQTHMLSFQSYRELANRMSVGQTIDTAHQALLNSEIIRWKEVLRRLLSATLFLAEQNLSFRGNSDKPYTRNNGNFLGALQFLAEFDPIMKNHLEKAVQGSKNHYLSPSTQNEFISLIAGHVNKSIVARIQSAKYYSMILDCTPDQSRKEQMTCIMRFVYIAGQEVSIEERFLGFLPSNDSTGKGLTHTITTFLEINSLQLQNCRGQGYDNGSNMKGVNNGVQAWIRRANPRAFYTPCGCHSLNLLLKDVANVNATTKLFFAVIQRLYTLFSASVNRWETLCKRISNFTLKPVAETRWESRVESVKAIRYQMPQVIEALKDLYGNVELLESKDESVRSHAVKHKSNDPMIRHEAKALEKHFLLNFDFILQIVIWYDLLVAVNRVSKLLQKQDMAIDTAVSELQRLVCFFNKFRDSGFESARLEAKKLADELGVEPDTDECPRRCRTVRRMTDNESYDDAPSIPVEDHLRTQIFYPMVDVAINVMADRFQAYENISQTFGFLYDLRALQECRPEQIREQCKILEERLTHSDSESKDIDAIELAEELLQFRFLIQPGTSLLDALKYIFRCDIAEMYPNTAVALRIALTQPITVAAAERTFSKLKLIKTYLRSTMSQDRLTGLATISIEKDLARSTNYDQLIKDFAESKARKLFGY